MLAISILSYLDHCYLHCILSSNIILRQLASFMNHQSFDKVDFDSFSV